MLLPNAFTPLFGYMCLRHLCPKNSGLCGVPGLGLCYKIGLRRLRLFILLMVGSIPIRKIGMAPWKSLCLVMPKLKLMTFKPFWIVLSALEFSSIGLPKNVLDVEWVEKGTLDDLAYLNKVSTTAAFRKTAVCWRHGGGNNLGCRLSQQPAEGGWHEACQGCACCLE